MYIAGIYFWITNRNEDTDTVKQYNVKKKEWIIIVFFNIDAFALLYLLLKSFNTNQLIVSTFSMLASLMATYLIVRRSKYAFLFYAISDMILVILWGIPVLQGDISLIPILIEPLLLLTNHIYGWKKWNKEIPEENLK